MRKIVYIGNALSSKGNTTTVLETLSEHLIEEGFEMIIASSKKSKPLRLLDMCNTIIHNKKTASLVLIDTYSTQNFYYAITVAKLCRRFNIPYVPILHGGNLPERLDRSPKLSRQYFQNAKFTVAPSQYLIEAFVTKGYEAPLYIPNSIRLQEYSFLQREKISAKLLWVRSFSEIYNPLLALQIVQQLQQDGVEVSLTMVGPEKDGSLETCRAFSAQHSLPVTFTGKLSKVEWTSLAAAHDIFINTTNFDNMPVSIVEAMALGMPIISTKVGGIPFLIENDNNGLLVPPANVAAFVMTIKQLIPQTDIVSALSKNARAYSQQFDWVQVRLSWLSALAR